MKLVLVQTGNGGWEVAFFRFVLYSETVEEYPKLVIARPVRENFSNGARSFATKQSLSWVIDCLRVRSQ